ncbi:MAG: glycosyltransferase family 2 protein [Candidatus Omnitrophica bacterium]|nr:glycosyltransferase family 2 protein [Candidatus Omnitrophota bacterium]
MDKQDSGISFIFPAYNEAAAVGLTLAALKKNLRAAAIPSEIILVNDGSTDATAAEAEKITDIRIINHPSNLGYGHAIKTALPHTRYEWIGIIDADDSYPADALPQMLAEMARGFDMVVAARQNLAGFDRPLKQLLRRLYVGVVNFVIIGTPVEDPNSGFRIFKKKQALEIFPFLCGTFSFTTSLTIMLLGNQRFVKYLPIQLKRRRGASKVRPLRDSIRTIQLILETMLFLNPSKYFILIIAAGFFLVLIPSFILAQAAGPAAAFGYLFFGLAAMLTFALGAVGYLIRSTATLPRLDTIPYEK